MKTFKVQLDCGCCFEEVQFETRELAEYTLRKAQLGNGKTITDSCGKVVEGVDTFYGIMEENESTENPLGRLLANFGG